MRTELSFKFIEDYRDCTSLAIADTSTYNTDVTTTCPIVEINVPNFTSWLRQEYTPNTTFLVTAQSLTLSTTSTSLPGGWYKFRMSVNPNDLLYVQYNYLNICCDMASLTSILCYDSCDEMIEKVMKIEKKLKAAKLLVEGCNDTFKGVALYNMAVAEINKLLQCV